MILNDFNPLSIGYHGFTFSENDSFMQKYFLHEIQKILNIFLSICAMYVHNEIKKFSAVQCQ